MLLNEPPACSTQRAVPVFPTLIMLEESMSAEPPSILTVAISVEVAEEP